MEIRESGKVRFLFFSYLLSLSIFFLNHPRSLYSDIFLKNPSSTYSRFFLSLPYSFFLHLFFSLSFLLAQTSNLLEPRDPNCYVNGLNTDTRALILYVHTPACTYKPPFHHICTHAPSAIGPNLALQLLASVQLSLGLSLTSWCSVYMNCQSQPNQKLFPLS